MNVLTARTRLERDRRRAFTLVELLVVITIIALVASITLLTLSGVREDARERRARSQIARIHELIMRQWESYRTRAVPVKAITANLDPVSASDFRLYAVRELMRMELPDRKSDLLLPVSDDPSAVPLGQTQFLISSPTLWRTYVRRARQQILGKNGLPLVPANWDAWKNDTLPVGWTLEHESAECLYLILAAIRDGDTTGLDFFSEGEIGDVDNDGMPEILDPWGVPIYFVRWAAGFRSDVQLGDIAIDPVAGLGDAGTGNGDPFDPLKRDPRWHDAIVDNDPFLLFPLIVSAGRDKQFDILLDFALPLPFNPSAPYPYADPYATDPMLGQLGSPTGAGYGDNVTSHFLEVR